MSFFHNFLEQTQEPSEMEAQKLHWITFLREGHAALAAEMEERDLPLHLLKPPTQILHDTQNMMASMHALTSETRARVIGFASAVPGEGTSTVVSLLAAQIASPPVPGSGASHAGHELEQNSANGGLAHGPQGIMLIDTQWRNPDLHNIFRVNCAPGLHELLAEQNSLPAVTGRITGSNLRLITAGRTGRTALTQIDLERLEILLSYLRTQYAMIFLDLPALMHFPEGIKLSKLCDGLVFIVRAHKTREEVVAEAMSLLHQAQVKVSGLRLESKKIFRPGMDPKAAVIW